MKVLSVVGTRQDFKKLAPLARELGREPGAEHLVVHTGRHCDAALSDAFLRELGLPEPTHRLDACAGSLAAQTAALLTGIEPVLCAERPDVVLVYGDVNSTLAAALAAAKLNIPVAHVEAGLRSRDRTVPEELNRILTDQIADALFAPSSDAVQNLRAEGRPRGRIHFVGNIMIDALVEALPRAREAGSPARFGLSEGRYALVTLHRPANVDEPERLRQLLEALEELSHEIPMLFPVHPRTRSRMREADLHLNGGHSLRLLEPIGYLEMLGLTESARLVITDSGGLQEETSFLGVPCLTVRPSTERPITCLQGTNRLVTPGREQILAGARRALAEGRNGRPVIDRWDGHAAARIADVLLRGASF